MLFVCVCVCDVVSSTYFLKEIGLLFGVVIHPVVIKQFPH